MDWVSNLIGLVTIGPTPLPDHDIANLLESPTSTKWTHTRCCPKCLSPIGHQEFMTEICLTCGRHMGSCLHIKDGAMRKIVRGGRWVQTLKIGCTEYRHVDGQGWKPIQ